MTVELASLLGCTFILFVSILIQGVHTDMTQGFKFSLGNRNRKPKSEGPAAARLANNVNNQMEGLALLIPLIVALEITQSHSSLSSIGALVYLISRAVYAALYMFGVPVIRSIAWFIGIIALGMIALSLIVGPPA